MSGSQQTRPAAATGRSRRPRTGGKRPSPKRSPQGARSAPSTAPTPAGLAVPAARGAGALLADGARGGGALAALAARAAGRGAARLLRVRDVQRALALGAAAGALALASSFVRAEVETWPRFRVRPDSLAVAELPAPLTERVREDLERLPLPAGAHAFDPHLVPWVEARLARLPWVRDVARVRLAPPNRLTFRLRAHEPLAQLDDGALVSATGALVPRAYGARADALPRLEGVPRGPRHLLRSQRALRAGIAVLDALREVDLDVAAVDLENLGGADPLRSEVVLRTRGGLEIAWGRPPGCDRPHLDADAKVARLETFLAHGPHLDRVARVSLRWEQVTYVLRPAAQELARAD